MRLNKRVNKADNDWFFNRDFDELTPKSLFKAWLVAAFIVLVFWLVIIAAIAIGLSFVF